MVPVFTKAMAGTTSSTKAVRGLGARLVEVVVRGPATSTDMDGTVPCMCGQVMVAAAASVGHCGGGVDP